MDRHARAKEAFVESDLQRDCSWNRMYQCLLQYRERHSDTLVLTNKESLTEVKKLGKWAQNQRVHYKYFCNGDRKHIKEHQIEALYQVSVCVRAMMIICDHDVACLVSGFYWNHPSNFVGSFWRISRKPTGTFKCRKCWAYGAAGMKNPPRRSISVCHSS